MDDAKPRSERQNFGAVFFGKLRERFFTSREGVEMSENPKPPPAVRQVAKNALERRQQHGRGGTEVGVARARDLAAGKGISRETLMRMKSFFARHSVDPKGDPTSAASIAWALWGGTPGRKWANAQINKMERAKKK